ncbi:hypothetical protein W97_09166 [Coniosporium apollinis CBS 100218]|uniref:DCUN1 domain-containing protein n=1 Tax=Coniosporium apollinis (strain CBS 100218) TaxID=1168221 RepID=R7Z6W0_CONA1|nr:uncharacterized protein W97_09166 [Coniosporium apollinis CBS 100218]EON69902.1 hypothetical protein W97_09166 [Coniosporium apollinis CBS 100218]
MPRQAYPALQRMLHPTAGVILGNRPWITAGTQAVAQRVSPYAAQMLQYQAVQSSNRNPHTSMPPANLQPPEAGRGAQGPSSTREGHIRARLPVTRVVLPAYMPSPAPITNTSGVPYDESMFRQLHENLRNIREAEHFQNNSTAHPPSSATKTNLNKLFDRYRDDPRSNPDSIGLDGASNYFHDIGVDLEDVGLFIVSEIVQSPSMGELTREGFVNGWSSLG